MSLTDYSSLENEISGAQAPTALPAGTEAKLRIINVRSGISEKNDCKWYNVVFDIPEEPLAADFSDFFWELDREHLNSKDYAKALYKFKSFATAFEIDFSRPFSWEDDLIGKEGWAILGMKKSDEYGDQNTVKKYVSGN